ncbi:MAG: hypothetical protein CMI13_04460 [Oleibacter sp.]|nr:hypothetical protein [Thalassolituus sp.]|tara:strand:- start:448 stop:975 length:528 start_codon:yes stop_codon:yes gene_type:complete
MKILVSACLLGQPVRYDGKANDQKVHHAQQRLNEWQQQGLLVPVCPEVAGGLPTPRPAAEIITTSAASVADGTAVLHGNAAIHTRDGQDVSAEFVLGAQKALAMAQEHGAVAALLAARSPSCGADGIYDGTFSGTLVAGRGVTAALLEQHGIRCFTPQQFAELEALVQQISGSQD